MSFQSVAVWLTQLVIAQVVFSHESAASSLVASPAVPQASPPPVQVFWDGELLTLISLGSPAFVGSATYNTLGKYVDIYWLHRVGAQEFDSGTRFPTSYWPTALASLNNGSSLAVCGKRRVNGSTVIEVWDFAAQSPPAAAGRPVFPKLLEMRTVYDSAVVGRDIVVRASRRAGHPTQLALQFLDSKDLYALTTTTEPGVLTLLASPTLASPAPPAGSVLHEPRLAGAFTRMRSSNHLDLGYVYIFDDRMNPMGSHTPLVLADSDRDGKWDAAFVPTQAEWVSMGLADGTRYVP